MQATPPATLDAGPFETWLELKAHLQAQGLEAGDPSVQGLDEARARHEAYLGALSKQEPLDGREAWLSFDAENRPHRLLLVEPSATVRGPCGILYLRGAGWWAGSLQSSRPVLHRLARETNMPVCAVDYRRIPEHPFPAQLEDALVALAWLGGRDARDQGLPQRWVLWGESAGASLAVCAAARALSDPELPAVAGMVLLYGNHAGPQVQSGRSRWIWEHYLALLEPPQYSRAIPTLQSVSRLPPAFLAVGGDDPLLSDSRLLHHHLKGGGLTSTLMEFPNLPHSFSAMASLLRPAQEALSVCAAAARSMAAHTLGVG